MSWSWQTLECSCSQGSPQQKCSPSTYSNITQPIPLSPNNFGMQFQPVSNAIQSLHYTSINRPITPSLSVADIPDGPLLQRYLQQQQPFSFFPFHNPLVVPPPSVSQYFEIRSSPAEKSSGDVEKMQRHEFAGQQQFKDLFVTQQKRQGMRQRCQHVLQPGQEDCLELSYAQQCSQETDSANPAASETTTNSEKENNAEALEELSVREIEDAMQLKVEYDEVMDDVMEVRRRKRIRMTNNHVASGDNVDHHKRNRHSPEDGESDDGNRQDYSVYKGHRRGDAFDECNSRNETTIQINVVKELGKDKAAHNFKGIIDSPAENFQQDLGSMSNTSPSAESNSLIVHYPCVVCKRSVITSGSQIEHDGSSRQFRCNSCIYYNNFRNISSTKLFCTEGFMKRCYICGFMTYSEFILKRHMMKKHGIHVPLPAVKNSNFQIYKPFGSKINKISPAQIDKMLCDIKKLSTAHINKGLAAQIDQTSATPFVQTAVAHFHEPTAAVQINKSLAAQIDKMPAAHTDKTFANINPTLHLKPQSQQPGFEKQLQQASLPTSVIVDRASPKSSQPDSGNDMVTDEENWADDIDIEIEESEIFVELNTGNAEYGIIKGVNNAGLDNIEEANAEAENNRNTSAELEIIEENSNDMEIAEGDNVGRATKQCLLEGSQEIQNFKVSNYETCNESNTGESEHSEELNASGAGGDTFDTDEGQGNNVSKEADRESCKPSYQCIQCSFITSSYCKLRKHIVRKIDKKVFKCDRCDFTSCYVSPLKTHKRIEHPTLRALLEKRNVGRHVAFDNQTKQNVWIEKPSQEVPPAFYQQKYHQQQQPQEQQQLPHCLPLQQPESAGDEVEIIGEKIHNPGPASPSRFYEDTSSITNDKNIMMETYSNNPIATIGNTRIYGCAYCDLFSLDRMEILRHVGIHRGSAPYACSACHRRFFNQVSLLLHEKIHQWE